MTVIKRVYVHSSFHFGKFNLLTVGYFSFVSYSFTS